MVIVLILILRIQKKVGKQIFRRFMVCRKHTLIKLFVMKASSILENIY
jgi:hypothetical protein